MEALESAIAEVLEVEKEILTKDLVFANLPEFDSIKILSLMVVLDEHGVALSQNKIASLVTYGDLLNMIKGV